MSFVNGKERVDGRAQQLQLDVSPADLTQPCTEIGDRRVVRIEQTSFGEEGMHERVVCRALDNCPELSPRHEHGMNVDAVGVEGQRRTVHLLVVDGDQQQVDVRLCPDRIVRQAAAEHGGEDGLIAFDPIHQPVESRGEPPRRRSIFNPVVEAHRSSS